MTAVGIPGTQQSEIKVVTDVIASMTRFLSKLSENVGAKHSEVGMAEWTVLRHVSETPGIRAGQIARRLEITGQRVNQLVKSLREAGLIETRPVAGDSRVRAISITAAGAAKLAEMDKDVSVIFAIAFAGKPQALAQLRGRVRRLAKVAAGSEDV